ncbi:hypothetical protein ACHAP8_006027 [Fusarium lateritium]
MAKLLTTAAAATVGGLAAAITGDFPFTVLVEGTAGDGAWSLITEAESDAVAAAATADDDCSGDCGMVGVAARSSDAEGAAGGSVAIAIALSGAAGLFISTAIARVEVESGVGAWFGDATLEVEGLGAAADESAGDMGSSSGGAIGLGLSLSTVSMTRFE